ncbi:putative nuclease HARBI1 [Toxorhynchites rutilus septentrionalis]|uniref:putative nuclease HARBI1 n=1 Tax=Toxorhynchites rutilus septentrionalis TaxID=329112 RepID=UPI00247936E4|nr:putative nuclease HARBI1 [Toxorhynchites rutilus septentrionalis]
MRLERRKLRDKCNPLEIPHDTFVNCFRVSKDLFKYLLNIVERKSVVVGSSSVLPIIKLSAALIFFAEGSYQRGVANDLFAGMAQLTLSKALASIISILETEVCPTSIQFPLDEASKNAIKYGFYKRTGFPGVIGCVDGTHIRIISPCANVQHLYYNRKGFHSLNVMLICDHKQRIRYVDANNPGSNHDSFIWNKSPLDSVLNEKHENGERNTWLLGDAGYPLKPYLITPFRTSISAPNFQHTKFNEIHSKTRMIVERTIGVMKNVFRCTLGARQLHYKPEKATRIVNVCCALHNLRLQFNVPTNDEDWLSIENDEMIETAPNDEINISAIDIRQQILSSIT